jgi:DNA-directed RNA polymerase specialized sigma24 family protein
VEPDAHFKLDVDLFRSTETAAAAWEELFRRYDRRLRGKVRAELRAAGLAADPERVREIVQDVYCRLLDDGARRLCQCRSGCETRLRNFLLRVAERVTLDHLRWVKAQRRRPDLWSSRGWHVPDALALLMSGRETPEEALLVKERLRLLLRECNRLSRPEARQRNRRVIRLAMEGWTSGEISRALGGELRPSGIQSLLVRMRRSLDEQRQRRQERGPSL